MDSSLHQLQMAQIKHRIDALMDLLYGAGVASHHTIIEQINYLMFLRALTKRDDEAIKIDNADKMLFTGTFTKYRWDNLLMLNAEELFTILEKIYRELPAITADSTIALLYRDAHVKIYEKPTLRRLLHEIEKLMTELEADAKQGSKDIFGDMYEYLLSKQAQAGTMGQFRTPRHIIKFITEIVDPAKGETILDPACGTAGFLVAAFKVLQEKYTSEKFKEEGRYPLDLLDPQDRKFIYEHAFTGFDSDADMIKFGLMNLYLHQLEHPQIIRQNTLVDTAGNRDKWNIILANPPFSGALDKDSISEDLRMDTRATEILFLRYMIDHLKENGRAGVIVPEGIIFSNSNAHKKIRQILVEEAGLWCVVSLPAGIFNPYAGVKTSILFFDKSLKEKAKDILFVKIEDDGFDLGAQKRPIDKNDLPHAKEIIKSYKISLSRHSGLDPESIQKEILKQVQDDKKINIVSKQKIAESGDYNLSRDRYKIEETFANQKWPFVSLDIVLSLEYGKALPEKERKEGLYDVVGSNGVVGKHNEYLIKGPSVIVGRKGSAGEVVWIDNDNYPIDTTYFVKVKDNTKLNLKYAYYILKFLNLSNLRNGGGVPGLNRNDAYKLKIPLPLLEIQQQIVEELDDYQKIISSAKQVIESWRPRIEINDLWTKKKLGEICEFTQGIQIPKTEQIEKLLDGYKRYLYIQDFKGNDRWIYVKDRHTSKEVTNNDLVMANTGTPGRAFLGVSGILSNNLFRITFDNKVLDKKFLYYYLEDVNFQDILQSQMKGGIQKHLGHVTIAAQEIYLPPIKEQKIIVEKIEEEKKLVEGNKKLIEIYEQKVKSKIAEVWGE